MSPFHKLCMCRRANNALLYINGFPNHPPVIIKQLPKMINREFQIYLIIRKSSTKLNLSIKQYWRIMDIFHQFLSIIAILKMLKEIETERLFDLTYHIAKRWKQTLVSCSSKLWGNTCKRTTNIARFSSSSYCCPTNAGNIIK